MGNIRILTSPNGSVIVPMRNITAYRTLANTVILRVLFNVVPILNNSARRRVPAKKILKRKPIQYVNIHTHTHSLFFKMKVSCILKGGCNSFMRSSIQTHIITDRSRRRRRRQNLNRKMYYVLSTVHTSHSCFFSFFLSFFI